VREGVGRGGADEDDVPEAVLDGCINLKEKERKEEGKR
jgi:hypothetical protein